MILLIDNYDSFSYNLYQMAGSFEPSIEVRRNDEITPAEIKVLCPDKIILSPGPGNPSQAGICVEVVRQFAGIIPILGVCLGHQAICEAYGANVSFARKVMHGRQSEIKLDTSCPLFYNLPDTIKGARYHSLAVLEKTLPNELQITARTEDNEIMAVKHYKYEVYGVQFHPESILTPEGKIILKNFIGGNPL
ncbi:aminodeoxychorismate/anthranilate synthase component II [Sinanaerobacter sp. ZZT-01]|uniref:anthranilate synthase component II n=1 Tax=Sinanaerobacter sp. ZZT-01 TaxID=3111540 RepID=UPI002D779685|nr:aminodeoxychorismate/anthranilate synthase component II [Sinanaerobacter sp. ZZT-01]WRR94273.1 aminodeoxychorismate/anthranilate synthase component II [Sinanaerobacter sp. ZZT-01]